jgi:monooxygenase
VFGYINASWTPKADLVCAHVARLIAHMDRKGYAQVTPRNREPGMPTAAFIEHFSSGYIQRALAQWPRQGLKAPWRVKQNYFADIISLMYAPIANEALEFSSRSSAFNIAAGSAPAARRVGA